jgi:hypothetical protein
MALALVFFLLLIILHFLDTIFYFFGDTIYYREVILMSKHSKHDVLPGVNMYSREEFATEFEANGVPKPRETKSQLNQRKGSGALDSPNRGDKSLPMKDKQN